MVEGVDTELLKTVLTTLYEDFCISRITKMEFAHSVLTVVVPDYDMDLEVGVDGMLVLIKRGE